MLPSESFSPLSKIGVSAGLDVRTVAEDRRDQLAPKSIRPSSVASATRTTQEAR